MTRTSANTQTATPTVATGWRGRRGLVRQRPHRVTTRHLQAAYPFQTQGAITARGCLIGVEANGGGAFTYCPWTFEAEHPGLLSNPNMLVLGNQNAGKSTGVKAYLYRQVGVFGRRAIVTDVKREYVALARALGGTVISLRPSDPGPPPPDAAVRGGSGAGSVAGPAAGSDAVGVGVRLNPLSPWAPRADRLMLLYAVTEVALGRPLTATEKAMARAALDAADAAATTTRAGEATLPDVVRLLFAPTPGMAAAQGVTAAGFAADAREVTNALDELVAGQLAGMFDGPTSAGIALDAPITVLDIADPGGTAGMGILMLCATAWQRAAVMAGKSTGRVEPTIHVTDEAWRALGVAREAEAAQERTKLSRDHNVSSIYLVHKLADLKASGDAGSRVRAITENLVADCATRVIYAQPPSEIPTLRDALGLTDTEIAVVTSPRIMRTGQALWKIADRSFLVQTLLSPAEAALVATRETMARAAPAATPHLATPPGSTPYGAQRRAPRPAWGPAPGEGCG
jgi:hypothetical protein